MRSAVHDHSTEMLRALLQHGISLAEQRGSWRGDFQLGPYCCAIVSNSAKLYAALTRCLVPSNAGSDLRISVLSGSQAPFEAPPNWNLPHTDERHVERLHMASDRSLTAMFNPDVRQWLIFNHASNHGLLWIAEESQLPEWEQGSPFKTLLNWRLAPGPGFMVHAGAVAGIAGGCLLVGQGGSGKSTTVAACFERGMSVCGDDLIMVEERPAGYDAWALYNSVKLSPAGTARLPAAFAGAPFVTCVEKRLMRYTDLRPDGFVPRMPLKALFRCVVAHRPRTAILPESKAMMLKSLAPPTVFLLRGREEEALPKIGRLIRQLPCYRIELGLDPAEASGCLQAWLEEHVEDADPGGPR